MTHIYIADISELSAQKLNRYCLTLPQYRKDKIERLKSEEGKRQSVAAGVLLDMAADDFGISDRTTAFTEKEKPYFTNSPDCYFNLSHTKGRAMCIMSDMPAGCDVERISSYNDGIAKRFFTADEYAFIMSEEEEKRPETFCRFWTLKESFIKCTGEGMSRILNSFSIRLNSPNPEISIPGYSIYEYSQNDGCRYAWCLKGSDRAEIKIISL